VLPVAQFAADAVTAAPTLVANDDICFFTCGLPQVGQRTPSSALLLRSSLSNG
jgi:hypothetical protein